jgi:hypothetical protein
MPDGHVSGGLIPCFSGSNDVDYVIKGSLRVPRNRL